MVELDAADNDYPRFLAHLLAAIESSGVQPGEQFRHILRYGARLAPGTCADLLTSALDTRTCRLTICHR